MQSYTTPGEELKSRLTEEIISLAWVQRVNTDSWLRNCLILFFHSRTAVDWKPVDQAHLFLHVLLLSACLRFFPRHAHFPQSVCPCKLGLLKTDPVISG